MRVTLWFCIINFTPIPINTSGRLADILIILSIANIMCFLSVIYSRKLTPDSFNEIEYIITCLLTIYSITAAFGNYYYCQGMIQNDDLVFLTCTRQEFLFSDTYFKQQYLGFEKIKKNQRNCLRSYFLKREKKKLQI